MAKLDSERQLALLAEQMNRIREQEQAAEADPNKKKGISWTKLLINSTFVLITLLGVVASLEQSPISMDKYIQFLGNFAAFWAPLVLAYAGGSSYSNYVKAKKEIETGKPAE